MKTSQAGGEQSAHALTSKRRVSQFVQLWSKIVQDAFWEDKTITDFTQVSRRRAELLCACGNNDIGPWVFCKHQLPSCTLFQNLLKMLNEDRKVFRPLDDEYDAISQLLLARFTRLVTLHLSRCCTYFVTQSCVTSVNTWRWCHYCYRSDIGICVLFEVDLLLLLWLFKLVFVIVLIPNW